MLNHTEPSTPLACLYEVDGELRLVSVDENWAEFARLNDTPALAQAPIGQSVLTAISDPMTALIYQQLFERIALTGRSVTYGIRCDSPRLRRTLDLTIEPRATGFRVNSTIRHTEANPGGFLLQAGRAHKDSFLRVCSWCKKAEIASAWHELDEAVQLLRLFEGDATPAVTHGICPSCSTHMYELIKSL